MKNKTLICFAAMGTEVLKMTSFKPFVISFLAERLNDVIEDNGISMYRINKETHIPINTIKACLNKKAAFSSYERLLRFFGIYIDFEFNMFHEYNPEDFGTVENITIKDLTK